MRIAVTTPTRNVGTHLTGMLIRAGVRPLLLARTPSKIPVNVLPYVDVVEADSTDAEQVAQATRGVDATYWVDPSTSSADPMGDYARATQAIVEAVETNANGRIVFQSSVGAEKRHGVGEIDALAATEVALDALNADVTHLRCGYFFTNLLLSLEEVRHGRLPTVLPLEHRFSWVAPRDIAEVAAMTLLNPLWHGHRVQAVHGPQDLSCNDVAALLTRLTGRHVRAEQISDDLMRQQYLAAGMPPAMADAVLDMSTGLRDDFYPEQPRTAISTTPTRLAGRIQTELIPAL